MDKVFSSSEAMRILNFFIYSFFFFSFIIYSIYLVYCANFLLMDGLIS